MSTGNEKKSHSHEQTVDAVHANTSAPKTSDEPAPSSNGQLSKEIVTALQGEAGQTETTETQEDQKPESRDNLASPEAGLSDAELEQVEDLKARDREVRAHEQAHAAVGGQYAGSPTYEYQTGPDRVRYAVGGEVKIDVAPVPGDPSATITKMDIVIKAALAPAEPSSQDRKVAATASKQRAEAQAELNAQRQAELAGDDPTETEIPDAATISGSGSAPASPIINLFA
ncbi:putative metalloprotease CJM1_0395 family protein [Sneathiella limimaris]|uniref:putative metalloprotease CJM1_0395 family protein n=1 Tax=Sneathiella limimaris TaxID=1964213 RepID=UPI00146CE798|nr:putative metalloprotease CJM1_0395 family protein [Sneathiella limimaris]